MEGKGYIACAEFEDTIVSFGEGETPAQALSKFVDTGEFYDWCCNAEILDGEYVQVKVFRARYRDEVSESELDDWDSDWLWVLGDEVEDHQLQFLT